jgi:hypothetical protein
LLIGFIGAAVSVGGLVMEDRLCIDDPVGAFPTHALASVWGLIATGLFCERTPQFAQYSGLFKGGSWKFLGIQLLATVCITLWSAITTFIQLYIIDKIFGLRMTEEEEEVGADYYVHNIIIRSEEKESNTSEESHGIPSSQLSDGGRRTDENLAMQCVPVDMKNLREINSRHSSGKPKMQMNGNGIINIDEISLRVAPYLEQRMALPKGTSNCGYHSA